MQLFRTWFLICSLILSLAGGVSAENGTNQPFVVGTASGYAPYVSLNSKGEYEGFDIDLARVLADKLGRKLVLQDLGSLPSLLVALQKKKIDAIIWAISITESRQKEMEMIYYQGEKVTQMPFIFWKEVPKGVVKIEDLSTLPNCTICVEAGSYQDSILQKYPSLNVRYLDKIADGIMEIKYGKASSTLIDPTLIPRVLSQFPELKVLNLSLPENQQSLGNGICINKDNQALASQIKGIIGELAAQGKIRELEKKWKLESHQ